MLKYHSGPHSLLLHQFTSPSFVGSDPPDWTTHKHIASPHMPNDSIQGMGGISAVQETRVRRPAWSLPPLTKPLWPKGGAGAKLITPYAPLRANIILSSPSRQQTCHPPPRLRIIRCVCHVTAKSTSIPLLPDKDDTMLTSTNQSVPKTRQNWIFCQICMKREFFFHFHLFLLYNAFMQFLTRIPISLHSSPPI